MGLRYVIFRVTYEFKRKSGLLKKQFPISLKHNGTLDIETWRREKNNFFFESKADIPQFDLSKKAKQILKNEYELYIDGSLKFFNHTFYQLGKEYDWFHNPESNFLYQKGQHWTLVADLDKTNGDIKYVWEKSRFSFLYMLIRYDHYFDEDQSKIVFQEIENWIDNNPLNIGPNYKCSQEISIRLFNWAFALNYCKYSDHLNQSLLNKIYNSIYGQLHHIYNNIQFSRIAVRNNHAITETLALYLSELLFPEFQETKKWSLKGQRYLEQEILYQIYSDGSYLQHSHNYHRVVIQLMTWACVLGDKSKRPLSDKCKSRIRKTLDFLYQHQIIEADGQLPNYGNNDGALFFPLNQCDYRDFRPQLNALNYYFTKHFLYPKGDWIEDSNWYFGCVDAQQMAIKQKSNSYSIGGYYVINNNDTKIRIRCGSYKDRPAQADNLHVDIWHNGVNIMRDAGTYKYNTSSDLIKFFMGTKSHNTIMIADQDQMKKGGRFIWYNWSKSLGAELTNVNGVDTFKGSINAFKHVDHNIIHTREVVCNKGQLKIEIIDQIKNSKEQKTLIWNPHQLFFENGYMIEVFNEVGEKLDLEERKGAYSSYYGNKEDAIQLFVNSMGNYFKTVITKK